MRTLVALALIVALSSCRTEPLRMTNSKQSISNGVTFTYALEQVEGWNVMIEDTLWQEEQKQVQEVLSTLREA